MSLTGKTISYIQNKFPNASFLKDIILQDDGDGPYVKYWFGQPVPTPEELNQEAADFIPPATYPTVDAQLRMIYNDMKNGTKTFVAEIDKHEVIPK